MRFFSFFCAVSLLTGAGATRSTAEIIGQSVPRAVGEDRMKASLRQIELVDDSGARLAPAALLANGKPTLVILWAHWRPNCHAEIAGLRTLAGACPSKWNLVFVSSRFSDYAKDLTKFRCFGLPWKLSILSPET
jgi:hypothetical protein